MKITERVKLAIFRAVARRNPDAIKRAAQPVLDAAVQWERVLSLEPGSEAALELEKQTGKSLAELKAQAETMADFLRRTANIGTLLTK